MYVQNCNRPRHLAFGAEHAPVRQAEVGHHDVHSAGREPGPGGLHAVRLAHDRVEALEEAAELLALVGVTDLEPYNCVPGGKPIRIVDEGSAAALWRS